MSWQERVRKAGGADKAVATGKHNRVALLKSQVESMVNVDTLAKLAADNLVLAKSEVKSACRRAFESAAWADVEEDERAACTAQLMDALFGMGILQDLVEDESVTEIMVNGPDKVFFERGGVIVPSERTFSGEAELRALIDRILGPLGRRIDEASPMVNARLEQGHRVNAVVPPIALDGPALTIRKFRAHVLTLEEMAPSMGPGVGQFLTWAVQLRKSIAVSGGTGSGKTTVLNALSCKIPPGERIITIEDSAELRFFEHPHVVRLEARPRNAEGMGEVTIRDLVTNSLRMRPDRIVVGEVRGSEALDMLQAMLTGHSGSMTTLHANTPAESVSRLATMVRYGADLPIDVIERNIASAIDLVVQTKRTMDGTRLVTEVVTFSFDEQRGRCMARTLYERRMPSHPGTWKAIPDWFNELVEGGIATEEEARRWQQSHLA